MRLPLIASLLLTAAFGLGAQTPPKPQAKQASGAAPNKVWVNTPTKVYHCPGARYYGRTKQGQYMSEPDALKAGNKPANGDKCFK
jgi:hypothetical protein